MELNYIEQLKNMFKNMVLNAVGAERDLYRLINDKDIYRAIDMMQSNDTEVDKAIREYNPQTHEVMNRRDKDRRGKKPYTSEKLPRTRQRYINEIELFFLLGKPIIWKKKKGEDEAYQLFADFLDKMRFNTLIRKAKRLAGAETESAMVINLTNDNGEIQTKSFVVARSLGYKLRPMFDQYGNMMAFAYGYSIRQGGGSEEHWDILTPKFTFYCKKGKLGWEVETYENITGKINAIYFQQTKAWDGAVPRIHREEMLDSRGADTNNYFMDPIAAASADVIESLAEPDTPGKMIRLSGSNSRFEYITPPGGSAGRAEEKRELNDSILFDTFTPDFSYNNMKGLGSLSGAALHNALIIGYIKRDNRIEIYGEMVDRLKNVIIAVLKQQHPDMAEALDGLKIEFQFGEPFDADTMNRWNSIAQLYGAGLMSLETAVAELGIVADTDSEIERIQMMMAEREQAQQEAAEKMEAVKNPEGPSHDQIKAQQQEKEAQENENAGTEQ